MAQAGWDDEVGYMEPPRRTSPGGLEIRDEERTRLVVGLVLHDISGDRESRLDGRIRRSLQGACLADTLGVETPCVRLQRGYAGFELD